LRVGPPSFVTDAALLRTRLAVAEFSVSDSVAAGLAGWSSGPVSISRKAQSRLAAQETRAN